MARARNDLCKRLHDPGLAVSSVAEMWFESSPALSTVLIGREISTLPGHQAGPYRGPAPLDTMASSMTPAVSSGLSEFRGMRAHARLPRMVSTPREEQKCTSTPIHTGSCGGVLSPQHWRRPWRPPSSFPSRQRRQTRPRIRRAAGRCRLRRPASPCPRSTPSSRSIPPRPSPPSGRVPMPSRSWPKAAPAWPRARTP